jgi:small ligand-binding sensory domain FIST
MSIRTAVGLATDEAGPQSFADAAARAALGLGDRPCDLAVVLGGGANAADVAAGAAIVRERLHPRALIGAGVQGVLGAGHELEQGGATVWAASLPGAQLDPFRLAATIGEGQVTVAGIPELGDADAVILVADPHSFPVDVLLAHLNDAHPGLPLIGGLASAGPDAALVRGDEAEAGGAVGVVVRGAKVITCVSQGARPIGPEMAITDAEDGVIRELASQPALERVREAIGELPSQERALAARGLMLGVVVDPNKPDYERGDFLVRAITGADEDSGALSVGADVRFGQTVRLQVRDGAAAHEDLMETLDRAFADRAHIPAGALLFTCNGRGRALFGVPDHDAQVVADALQGVPTGGFFCAGEIGPVGERSYVHGYTATLAVFLQPDGER